MSSFIIFMALVCSYCQLPVATTGTGTRRCTGTGTLISRRLYHPLINGPPLLRLHQVLEVVSPEGGKLLLDFVPARPDYLPDLLTLILGRSVEGTLRSRLNDCYHPELQSFATKATMNFSSSLNLYNNNCGHFVSHCENLLAMPTPLG